MAGGTLLISRATKNHSHFKTKLEALGFYDVTVTALDKDALKSLIRELKPKLILVSASFYYCCTPFLMGELHKKFPKIKMAAVSLSDYPADLAMYFILNGVNSYVNYFEGVEQFYKGLDEIANGREYISPDVIKRIKLRRDYPEPAGQISERHKQVIKLICCGFKDHEIANILAVSRNTIVNHKANIFTSLNVRSNAELFRTAQILNIVRLNELDFYPKEFMLKPLPKKQILKRIVKK